METIQSETDDKLSVLKQIMQSDKEDFEKEKGETNQSIQGYLSSMRKEYDNGN